MISWPRRRTRDGSAGHAAAMMGKTVVMSAIGTNCAWSRIR